MYVRSTESIVMAIADHASDRDIDRVGRKLWMYSNMFQELFMSLVR